MCLILLAYNYNIHYPLIVAANRDEFYDRPTEQAHFWGEHPDLLAGRDLKYGGTWMGVTLAGKFAAVTNYRDITEFREHPLSRGLMVKDFLTGEQEPLTFLLAVRSRQEEYNGFNLLIGDHSHLYSYSNKNSEIQTLEPGIYGLSNHLLDTPWPKVERSKLKLLELLEKDGSPDPQGLFEILADRRTATDDELPDTGFGLQWERTLSSPFIVTPTYGTRTSTVLLVDSDSQVWFEEHSFAMEGKPAGTVHHEFTLAGL